MDLKTHLAAYRAAVAASALEGCNEFARKDAAFEQLSEAMRGAKWAADDGRVTDYRMKIALHQHGMIELLQKMVEEEFGGYDGIREIDLLNLISLKGLKWFKFCRRPLELSFSGGSGFVVRLIPRYLPEMRKAWDRCDRAVFDADELPHLFGACLGDDMPYGAGKDVLKRKLEVPGQKILSFKKETGQPPIAQYKPATELNKDWQIDDWSLPLWH